MNAPKNHSRHQEGGWGWQVAANGAVTQGLVPMQVINLSIDLCVHACGCLLINVLNVHIITFVNGQSRTENAVYWLVDYVVTSH